MVAPPVEIRRRGRPLARQFAWLAIVAVGLAACGGGGPPPVTGGTGVGAAPPPPPPPPPPDPNIFDTDEFRRSWGLDAIGALDAYDAGATGAGVTVAVVDTGVDDSHFDLSGKLVSGSTNIVTGNPAQQRDIDGHGTQVAGIIAAKRNNRGAHGVAFDARILSLRADEPGSCDQDCTFLDTDVAAGVNRAIDLGARIINLSLGSSDPVSFSLLNAFRRAAAADVLVVVSAGNESALASTNSIATLASDPSIAGHVIVVGAVDRTGALASFSNRAGTDLQDYFLVAPGDDVVTTGLNGALFRVSGTSFSAPHVSGAAALLLDLFPDLTGAELADLLLSSARDVGAPGVDDVFGRGALDLTGALAPAGPVAMPTGVSATELLVPVTATTFSFGPAFGDALTGASFLGQAIVLDRFRRPFRLDLRQLIGRAAAAPDLDARLHYFVGRRSQTLALPGGQSFVISFIDEAVFDAPAAVSEWERSLRPRVRAPSLTYDVRVSPRLALNFSTGRGETADIAVPAAARDFRNALLSGGGLGAPHMRLAGNDVAASLSYLAVGDFELGVSAAAGGSGYGDHLGSGFGTLLSATRHFGQRASLGLEAGLVLERAGPLATRTRGGFGELGAATTYFAGTGASLDLGRDWALVGRFSQGLTVTNGPRTGGVITRLSAIRTRAFSVAAILNKAPGGGRLALAVSQPLRVTRAGAILDLATARDYRNGGVRRSQRRLDLTPSGRELDFELAYRLGNPYGLSLQTNLLYQRQPGHNARADGAVSLYFELRRLF